ncbi:MAG: chromosome segregation protein SMC [Acidobacteriota bacterium]|nr:MAG: chromosome segregation protein SMC [Acidobacteriota bacterium]
MLRLERLEVVGFKSFPERTVVEFPAGVTAVVGPNGCGKSNIADAVQWALGEQSARALRGRRMEDVIFAGTEGRGPGGLAQVTLHLATRAGEAMPDGRERVQLTRRLFRTGESEYIIDGKPSRLQDIRSLLEQIRAGARTYAIIDQNEVAAFVVSKPAERRLFIEEAAGISGYKQRRRLAENRLEATRANLMRVQDVLGEVDRQRRSLKRQASVARRARRLDEQLRALRTVWYRRRHRELSAKVESLGELLEVSRRESTHLSEERGRLAKQLAESRVTLDQVHQQRESAVERAHEAQLGEQQLEREIETARARADGLEEQAGRHEGEGRRLAADEQRREADRRQLQNAHESLGTELADLERRLEQAESLAAERQAEQTALRERAAELEAEWYDCLHERAELSARLSAARESVQRDEERAREAAAAGEHLAESESQARLAVEAALAGLEAVFADEHAHADALAQARAAEERATETLDTLQAQASALGRELGACAGEKAALDSLEVRLAGAEPARQVLEQARIGRLTARGVVADAVSVERAVERAAEAWLGELLPAVIVDSAAQVLTAAGLEIQGSVRLVPLDAPIGGKHGAERFPEQLEADPRVRGRLATQVRVRAELDGQITGRLEDAVLVDRLETALELHRRFSDWSFLTPEGHAVYASGVVQLAGNGQASEEGLLARARRRDDLRGEIERLDARRSQAELHVQQARESRQQAIDARRQAEEAMREMHRRVVAARATVERAQQELTRLEREAALAGSARAQADASVERGRARTLQLEKQLATAETQINEARAQLESARTGLQQREQSAREAAAAASTLAADRRALIERRAALDRDLVRVAHELEELRARSEQGEQAREHARLEASRLRAGADEQESRLEALRQHRAASEREVVERTEQLEQLNARVHQLEQRHDLASEEFEGARARREQAALDAEKARLALEHDAEACREELGCSAESLPDQRPEGYDPELLDSPAVLRETIVSLKHKREAIGLVNPLAETEFEQLSSRFEELSVQRDDIDQTIHELTASIKQMNRESRERFADAFAHIRRHFKEQFALLFRGGRADLVLDDEENLLETGIEIMCQPPGKKLQSVMLLSGGEKALAATAVLFAIFRYQPPPFCLLDEVDAPLDDANVGRFADAVRGFTDSTQFILITHNKRSMEMADVLYGVTMPEPGVSNLVAMTLD